ncbi:MAG: DnaJ domain-containing protein [Caldithrix sp.]|nr:DnaJ domain-containing protein [Caldithrix sp.]
MGFLGKAIGIGLGFMLGGPLGAIMGGALGHMYDKEAGGQPRLQGGRCPHCGNAVNMTADGHCPVCGMQMMSSRPETNYDRQFVFYVSLASLAAKMAKADNVVTEDEVRAFDQFIRTELGLSVEERKIVARLFNEAKDSTQDAMAFARQFKDLIGYQPQVLQTMIHLLFRIAMADGRFHKAEEHYIQQVAQVFGLSQREYDQIKAVFIKQDNQAYQVLGVDSKATDREIKQAYKKLVNEYHPDKLTAKGVPEDFIKIANEKMADINNAYKTIRQERGL